jgi:hypothetical protein
MISDNPVLRGSPEFTNVASLKAPWSTQTDILEWTRGPMAQTEWKQTDGKVNSVASTNTRGRLQFIVGFTYEVEGETYEGKFYTFDLTHNGDPLVVKYDISIPSRNNLAARQRRINWIAVLVAVPVLSACLLLLWFSLRR